MYRIELFAKVAKSSILDVKQGSGNALALIFHCSVTESRYVSRKINLSVKVYFKLPITWKWFSEARFWWNDFADQKGNICYSNKLEECFEGGMVA